MPKFALDPNMAESSVTNSGTNFTFSYVRPEDLASIASEFTLCGIAVDRSSSVSYFVDKLNECLRNSVKACSHSPRAANLLVRTTEFNGGIDEIHGFKPLSQIDVDQYSITTPRGSTALCDAGYNLLMSIKDYGETLYKQDYDTNAIIFTITDGEENCSSTTANMVKELKEQIIREEKIESVTMVLIGINVNNSYTKNALDKHSKEAGYDQFIACDDASENSLAKVASFISKSISLSQNSLGTGGPSQQVASF